MRLLMRDLRRGHDRRVILGAPERWFHVSYQTKTRPVKGARNMAPFRLVEDYAVDRGTFRVAEIDGSAQAWCEATAAGVKGILRELREPEAIRLEGLDQVIVATEVLLRRLRANREALLREAFTKGHVVRLADVKARADAWLAGTRWAK